MNKESFIQKYLHEELTDSEYLEFVSLTESDPQFAEDVQIESILYAQHKQNLKKELISNSKLENFDIDRVEKKGKTSKLHSLFPLIRNIAAVFVLGFISYYLFTEKPLESSDTNSIASSYIETIHQPPPSLMNGNELNIDDPWTIGIESYKTQRFDLAKEQIELIPNRTNEQNLYLGLSRLYASDHNMNLDKSISDFQSILSSNKSPHKDEAQWFLSLAYLEKGEVEKATTLLQNIVTEKSWNHKKALNLIESLVQE